MCNLHVNEFFMKNFVKISLVLSIIISIFGFSYAQEGRRWSYWSDLLQVFENVVNQSNNDWNYNIQETAIDGITELQWSYSPEFKISNTLDYIKQHIDPYIQRVVYLWLIISTVWLIVCWFLLVTWWIWKSGWFEKVKWKIINALLWVFLLSWFYLFIKLMVWVINMFFGWY